MALDSINSGSFTNIQSVLEAARKRTASAEVEQVRNIEKRDLARIPKSSDDSLVARLYGTKTEIKQAEQPRLGARFDRYA